MTKGEVSELKKIKFGLRTLLHNNTLNEEDKDIATKLVDKTNALIVKGEKK